MKKQLTLLFVLAFGVSAFAGHTKDAANVFGSQAKDVDAAITTLPVWIETRADIPPGGLKAYADSAVSETTVHGFYVVITTHPREWRVSMNPPGLASPEGVRIAGEEMVARFKHGQFADGAINMARELVRLTQPQVQPVNQYQYADAPYRIPEERINYAQIGPWVIYGIFGVFVGALIIYFVIEKIADRSERIKRERFERSPQVRKPAPRPDAVHAQRVFDSYTPAQRQVMIQKRHNHHYASGAATDPVLFWMLIYATQPHTNTGPISSPSAPINDEITRRTESSSSVDSGSSPMDSGSSYSDSSGGGGSW